jgi:Fe-S-cluster containining protein
MDLLKTRKWYAEGLCFECVGCGRCCGGPEEGYIWISRGEIERAAEFLKMSLKTFEEKFLVRVGFRRSIIEHPKTRDCIFLTDFGNGKRGCAIYPVRPTQCRTWPFWTENLRTPQTWRTAGLRCPGIDHGPLFAWEQIEQRRTQKEHRPHGQPADDPAGSPAGL